MSIAKIIVNILAIGVVTFLAWFGLWGFAMFDCTGGLVFGIFATIGDLVLFILLFRTIRHMILERKRLEEIRKNTDYSEEASMDIPDF